jgi:murein DD-endopeptidase MepM/ murein hydrolase activator NlpD
MVPRAMRSLLDLETVRGLFAFGAALGLLLFPLLWIAHVGIVAVRQGSREPPGVAGLRVPADAVTPTGQGTAAASGTAPARSAPALGLLVPVQGVRAASLTGTFGEDRGGRRHEGLDIRAARGTPVVAAVEGRILSLLTSSRGGTEIYQVDASERYCLYYAHLQRYALGLRAGMPVASGAVIAYVGSTGNAPEDTPHLHFGLFRNDGGEPASGRCGGEALDPLPLLR